MAFERVDDRFDLLPVPGDLAEPWLLVGAARYFVPVPTRHRLINGATSVGANRSDLCDVAVLDGWLGEDEARVLSGRDAVSVLLPRTAASDGCYADGSFIQNGYHA